jgi:hypothetical protein
MVFFFWRSGLTTQMELSFITEKNTKQNVSSIWINKDEETRDKNAVICHFVLCLGIIWLQPNTNKHSNENIHITKFLYSWSYAKMTRVNTWMQKK